MFVAQRCCLLSFIVAATSQIQTQRLPTGGCTAQPLVVEKVTCSSCCNHAAGCHHAVLGDRCSCSFIVLGSFRRNPWPLRLRQQLSRSSVIRITITMFCRRIIIACCGLFHLT